MTTPSKIADRGWFGPGLRACFCLAMIFAMALPRLSHSQELHPDIPPNSHSSAVAQAWVCNDGFKQVAGFCVRDEVSLPSQDAFEFFDGQWRCQAGYRRSNGICVLPTAPEHATLIGGDRWECDWGFRKVAARCEEIDPPPHGYLDAEGRDWACFPGYERVADHCVRASGAETQSPPAPGSIDPPKSTPEPQAEGPGQ